MPVWEEDQREIISRQWLRVPDDPDDLTLAGAYCPNCLHPDAFNHILIGTGYVGSLREDSDVLPAGGYPDTTPVDCRCGQEGDDVEGCGRSGDVEVVAPP